MFSRKFAISLLLISAAIAHAAPLERIYVAPTIPYTSPAPDGSASPSVACPWDNRLVDYLARSSKQISVTQTPMEAKGQKLVLTATLGPTVGTAETEGPAWINVNGKLYDENGKVLGDFGFLDDRYAGTLHKCKQAIRLAEGLGDSIAGWLEEPKPGIKIARAIGALREDTIDPDIKKSCPWDTQLPSILEGFTFGHIYRVSDDIAKAQGKKLLMTVVDARLLGGALYTGSKWLKIVGSLVENDREIGSFVAMRTSIRGWTGCGITSRLNEEIAYDILTWLEKPSMNAYLGDATPSDEAKP